MPAHQVLVRTALAVILLAVVTHTRADPDLWGHVLFGKDIVSGRSIPDSDSYSFTADRAWINHEWLAECLMYLAFAIGGGPGLVVLKASVMLVAFGLLWIGLKRQQVDPAVRDLLMALAVVGTFPQANHVRPQIFSIVAFALLLWILVRGGRPQRLLLIPLVFAAWVNLHGGWIVGGGVLALWALLTFLAPVSFRGTGAASDAPASDGPKALSPHDRQETAFLFLAGSMALVGTLANPYGWRMWLFLFETVGFGRPEITDWQPIYRLGAAFVALWGVVALAAVAGAVSARQWDLRRLGLVFILGLASWQVSRLLPFFTIAVVLLLGRDIAAGLRAWRVATPGARSSKRLATALAIVIAGALIIGGAATSASNLTCVRIAADHSEPEIVTLVKERQLQGRLAVWFNWGEYAIWHFAPTLSVSIDGRRETVYSDQVMEKHLNFYYVPSSREAFLDATRPDHIWLRSDLPVVASLLADGWQAVYRGPHSVWLSRDGVPRSAAVTPPATAVTVSELGRRCFPGP